MVQGTHRRPSLPSISQAARATTAGRIRLVLLIALAALPLQSRAFGFEDVVDAAKALAAKPFSPPAKIPRFLQKLSYDQLRDIRYKPERALWRAAGSQFDLRFFHPGGIYDYAVKINIHDAQGVHPLPFRKDDFDYGKNDFADKIPADLGYAGFKIDYPLNRPGQRDEVISFVGASYFRALARDTRYGLSARGLAIDTGLESGEEFPLFREFWIDRPARKARAIRFYALLDSKRLTGAYQFILRPGKTTHVDVKATLFLREKIKEIGIAPLTSMFWYGENSDRPAGQWRPEVHDSDGLMMINGTGEQIWRPLFNADHLRISQFTLTDPAGFGLQQRDRRFAAYEDLETHLEKRPSAWITPIGQWGPGYIKLTEIPTANEFNDNVVAYWVFQQGPKPGEPFTIRYRIDWQQRAAGTARYQVVNSFSGAGHGKHRHRFVIDFAPARPHTSSPSADVEADIWVSEHGKLLEHHLQPNPATGGWRLAMEVDNPDGKPLELRAFLQAGADVLSETWSYLQEGSQ